MKEISKGERDRLRSRCEVESPSLERVDGEVGVMGREMYVSDFARMRLLRRPDRCQCVGVAVRDLYVPRSGGLKASISFSGRSGSKFG